MSLDNIRLPEFVIQDLFRTTLVDLNSHAEPLEYAQDKKGEINIFGGNKQHILLLVNHTDASFISDEQLTFLSGILTACKLTFEDIGLLNIASHSAISYKTISNIFNPRIVLLFGILPDAIQLPFVMPEFQRQSYNNQVYITVPSLQTLENNKDLKRKLWIALQQIFSL